MKIPNYIPGYRATTILLAIYAAVWIALEGNLTRVMLLAAGAALVMMVYLAQRLVAGTVLSRSLWLVGMALAGSWWALTAGVLTIVLMAVKTGLHAHGPEFTAAEIQWVFWQIPVWVTAGIPAGLGIGLLLSYWYEEPAATSD